jgi:hypothetical protein
MSTPCSTAGGRATGSSGSGCSAADAVELNEATVARKAHMRKMFRMTFRRLGWINSNGTGSYIEKLKTSQNTPVKKRVKYQQLAAQTVTSVTRHSMMNTA